jgi:hypothetical protein
LESREDHHPHTAEGPGTSRKEIRLKDDDSDVAIPQTALQVIDKLTTHTSRNRLNLTAQTSDFKKASLKKLKDKSPIKSEVTNFSFGDS